MEILNNQDPLPAIRHILVFGSFGQLLITLVPGDLCTGLGYLTDQFHTVCFSAFNVGQVLGELALLLCWGWDLQLRSAAHFIDYLLLKPVLCFKKNDSPTTVSMPEDLETFASHSYSASSSNVALWTTRIRLTPSEIISYFLPLRISLPSLNQRTYKEWRNVALQTQKRIYSSVFTVLIEYLVEQACLPLHFLWTLHIRTVQFPSLWLQHHGVA